MEKQKISIIIPVYNAEKTLERCMKSIQAQSFGNFEVILVDDHSTDGSFKLMRQYAAEDDRVIALQSQGKGVSAARNTGLDRVGGDIIGFCDADDYMEQKTLETVNTEFFSDPEIACVVGGWNRVKETDDGKIVKRKCFSHNTVWSFYELCLHSIYDERVMGSVWNKYFKRELLSHIRFAEDLSYCEDTQFVFQICTAHKKSKAKIVSEPFYNYVSNPQSATSMACRDGNKLFDRQNRLKYNVSLNKMLRAVEKHDKMYWLIRRGKFTNAADAFRGFFLTKQQAAVLKREMKENLAAYLLFPFANGFFKNMRRLLSVMQKWNRKPMVYNT